MEKPVAKYLDSSLCCELSQTPLAISDKNLASLAARGNHLDVPEKVINTGANKGIDFQWKGSKTWRTQGRERPPPSACCSPRPGNSSISWSFQSWSSTPIQMFHMLKTTKKRFHLKESVHAAWAKPSGLNAADSMRVGQHRPGTPGKSKILPPLNA